MMGRVVAKRGLPRRRWVQWFLTKLIAKGLREGTLIKQFDQCPRQRIMFRRLVIARFGGAAMAEQEARVFSRALQREQAARAAQVATEAEMKRREVAWGYWKALRVRGRASALYVEQECREIAWLTSELLPPMPSFRRWRRPAQRRRRVVSWGLPRTRYGKLRAPSGPWSSGELSAFLQRDQRRQRLWRLCAIRFGDARAREAALALVDEEHERQGELAFRAEFIRRETASRRLKEQMKTRYGVLEGLSPEDQVDMLKQMYDAKEQMVEYFQKKAEHWQKRADGTALAEAEKRLKKAEDEARRVPQIERDTSYLVDVYRREAEGLRRLYGAALDVVKLQDQGDERQRLLVHEIDTLIARCWALERRLIGWPFDEHRLPWPDFYDQMMHRLAGLGVQMPSLTSTAKNELGM